MTFEGWLSIAILAAAVVLLVKKTFPFEVTALAIPVVLFVTGVLPSASEALQGFGNHAVLSLGAIFVVGAGLQEAGVTTLVAGWLQRVGRRGEATLILVIMVVIAPVSAFMSNAATTAVFIPAVVVISRRTGISPSRLLMPLAFAAVLGGNLTQIGTASNLVIGAFARERSPGSLGIFSFTPIGLLIVATGILYMMTVGRRLLPERSTADRLREAQLPEEVAASYGLPKTMFRMRVVPKSRVRGRTVAETGIRKEYGLQLVTVVRPRKMGRRFLDPTGDLVLASGDELYLEGSDEDAWRFAEEEVVQFGLAGPEEIERLLGRGMTLAEVALSPRSTVFGRSIRDLEFRGRYGLNVLSLWRKGAPVRDGLVDQELEFGDALLVSGQPDRVRHLAADPDFIVLTDASGSEDLGRAPLALGLLLLAVLPPIFGWADLAISGTGAAVLMIATGCLPIRRAHQAIDWKVLFLIMGTVPLGFALEKHDVTVVIAHGMLGATEPFGPGAVYGTLFLVSALLAITTSNAAAATIIAPIAATAAETGGLPTTKALLAVAYGCSCAYVLPFHQWNLLIMGPGGYRSGDYFRVGIGMSLAVAATAITALALSG